MKRPQDEESMARRQSLHDPGYAKPGIIGTMWNKYAKSAICIILNTKLMITVLPVAQHTGFKRKASQRNHRRRYETPPPLVVRGPRA
jgi:hypothetical protein